MLAQTVRSGLAESFHRGSAIAVDQRGHTLFDLGDPDRPIFYRSAIKPLQALVGLRGGLRLTDEEIAITCASHSGYPVHVAFVRSILSGAGLTEDDLQTPPDWPIGDAATHSLRDEGHRTPQRIWHNCSGKHAGWLATCRHMGWDTSSYLAPDHPLQQQVIEIVADATKSDPTPTGIDGCGAPTLRGTIRGLATAFARISSDPEFAATAQPIHRFPALVSSSDRSDGLLGAWWDGPMKGGAQGLLGAGRGGVGVAVRSESGSLEIAVLAMIAVCEALGLLSPAAIDALQEQAAPAVLGGGRPVGTIQPMVAP